MSDADELLKLKELLDAGILTQEEFNKKKDEILGNTKKDETEEPIKEEVETKTEQKKETETSAANNDKPKKESKHIAWWIFFVIFAYCAVIYLFRGEWKLFFEDALCAILCCPIIISWLAKERNIKLSTPIRILLILLVIGVLGGSSIKNTNTKVNSQNIVDDKQNTEITEQAGEITSTEVSTQANVVFVPQTNGKDFFENVLCGVTQYKGLPPQTLKADGLIPYDTISYMSGSGSTGDNKYSFDVTTNTNNEIANIQMFFFNYGKEDPTNYFMAATRLDYPTKDVAKLTDFISKNIGKDEKITIGDFTFHIFNGTSSNCVILDIYTEEWAKINGN